MKSIYIIDSNALAYKAYYAIRNLTDSKGNIVNALYGFLKMLIRIIENNKPDYVIAVFDVGKKTFRNDIYSDYKIQRKPMPDDLREQFPLIKEALKLIKIPVLGIPNFEADDVIGSLAKKYESDYFINIVSSDKDLNQLISEKIKILNSKKGQKDLVIVGQDEIEKKYDIKLEQFCDYLAIVGDTADNIPGVKGVGPKTTSKILSKYKTIDNIYENIDSVEPVKIRNKFIEHKEQLLINRKLVKIKTDLDLDFNVDESVFDKKNYEYLKEFLVKYGFNSIITDLNLMDEKVDTSELFELIEEDISLLKKYIVESKELNLYFYINKSKNIFISILNKIFYFENSKQEIFDIILDNSNKINLFGYDLKQFYKMMFVYDLTFKKFNSEIDYMILNSLISYKILPLEKIFFEQFHCEIKLPENIQTEQIDLFSDSVVNSNKKEIYDFFYYYIKLEKKIVEVPDFKIYKNIESKIISIVALMEFKGIKVEREELFELKKNLLDNIEKLKSKIFIELDEKINLDSPKQLSYCLFEKLNLPTLKKIKTGFSTDNEVLEFLKKYHPVAELVLHYRKLVKIQNTYVLPLLEYSKKDNKIHTTFNQTGTSTGRFSSTEPNLQNLPHLADYNISIKKAFKPLSENNFFLSFDYSQIELRILAHYSNDEKLLYAFNNDIDIHTATALSIFDETDINNIDREKRRTAKIINFGILYGMSPHGLSKQLNCPQRISKLFIEKYFSEFSGVKKYIDDSVEIAKKQGYVTTLFNRIRYIPELKASNKNILNAGIRMAVNMPIQGTSADILKLSMIKINDEIIFKNKDIDMLLTIHDELIFEIKKNNFEKLQKEIKKIMENIVDLNVPLKVNIKRGTTLEF